MWQIHIFGKQEQRSIHTKRKMIWSCCGETLYAQASHETPAAGHSIDKHSSLWCNGYLLAPYILHCMSQQLGSNRKARQGKANKSTTPRTAPFQRKEEELSWVGFEPTTLYTHVHIYTARLYGQYQLEWCRGQMM